MALNTTKSIYFQLLCIIYGSFFTKVMEIKVNCLYFHIGNVNYLHICTTKCKETEICQIFFPLLAKIIVSFIPENNRNALFDAISCMLVPYFHYIITFCILFDTYMPKNTYFWCFQHNIFPRVTLNTLQLV